MEKSRRTHSKQNLNPDYVVGLVDGEGSFTIYVRNPDAERKSIRRVMVEPKFYIKLIEKDKDILYALQDFFGCGSVYFQKDTRPNHQHCYRYEVYNRNHLLSVIIPFFQKHQLKLVSKRHDFKVFCQLVKMLKFNKHLKVEGLRKMYKLKQSLH